MNVSWTSVNNFRYQANEGLAYPREKTGRRSKDSSKDKLEKNMMHILCIWPYPICIGLSSVGDEQTRESVPPNKEYPTLFCHLKNYFSSKPMLPRAINMKTACGKWTLPFPNDLDWTRVTLLSCGCFLTLCPRGGASCWKNTSTICICMHIYFDLQSIEK